MGSTPFRLSFRLLALFIGLIHFNGGAQTYTEEPISYLKEIKDFFVSADKKAGTLFIEEEFMPFWGSSLSDAQRKDMYELSNTFARLRFKAYPEFHEFFKVTMAFHEDPNKYDPWVATIRALSKSKKTKLTDYIKTVAGLIDDGTVVDKSTVVWKIVSPNYTLSGDKSPLITFDQAELHCYAKGDSATVLATKGSFEVLTDSWIGTGGKVTWQRAGLSALETYANLSSYKISMKSTDFKADSVEFHNTFFSEPLLGILKENILAGKNKENSSFPQFESYEQRLVIQGIQENMDYEGGFSMKGRRLIGSGTSDKPASITIHRDDRPFIVAKSLAFTIRPDKIVSDDSRLSIYLSEDSITHPGLQFKYIVEDKLVSMVRSDEGVSKSPFFNSFHAIDMYFEAMYWNTKDPLMTMGNLFGSSNTRAAFESKDYYKEKRYYALQGVDPVHPLVRVRDLQKSLGDGFYLEDYSRATALPIDIAKKQLILLSNQGFLTYNLSSDYIEIRSKLEEYVMNRAGKRDYDILLFNSSIDSEPNATLNLVNFDMLLKGVAKINLSDSQRVAIYPDRKELTLKKNRDFIYSGVTVAGNLEIFGSDCRFSYDEFKSDIALIDSVRLNVEKFDFEGVGRPPMRQVKNVLEGGKGTVTIDHPRNKSGLNQDQVPQFPSFESLEESFVYYDASAIQGGAYDREEFYFKAVPYVLDSLDNFVANNISLDGTFISGIFPNIDHPLSVQPDYSLGFIRDTDNSGMLAYDGATRFNDKMILNYNGLQGDGIIKYLTASAVGSEFVFLPDSTIGVTSYFVNNASSSGVRVPDAIADKVHIAFIPDEELLRVSSIGDEISCFEGEAGLTGTFFLRPRGLEGQGLMAMSGAELESNLFTYTDTDAFADTSDFRLVGSETEFSFKTEGVNAHIDFNERKGTFKANGDASFVDFPANEYVCYMDKFIWFMDKDDLAMEYDGKVSNDFVIDTDLDLNKSNFYSTNENQDSLSFMAPKAVYDLKKSIITCNDIEFIKVADARIMPDSGSVVIRKKAKMDALENASLTANFVTQYHSLKNATIEIKSKNDYTGSGDYTYIDENKSEQIISFANIRVDSTLQTVAKGLVPPEAEFALSPAFQYSGDVELLANRKGLYFKGRTKVFHACQLDQNWMNFEAEIDPDEVAIPVDSSLTDEIGLPVGIGLMMNTDEINLYSTFLSSIDSELDLPLLTSSGTLIYDKASKEYLVGPADKLRESGLPGNLVALSTEDCQVRGEGKLDYGVNLGQIDISPVGKFVNKTSENSFVIDAMFPLDFHFSDNALKSMGEKLATYPTLKPLNIQESNYQMGIKEILGLEKADKLISELTLSGTVKKLPSELSSTLVLTDVEMTWDESEAMYVSKGKFGLANVGKYEVFAEVEGVVALTKRRAGDVLQVYIQLDDETWYYFEYARTLMQVFSSDQEFNDAILNEKEDDRKHKGEKGEDPYSYMLSSMRKVDIALEDLGVR